MNNQSRQALREIVAKHGSNVCSDAKRCAGLLRDRPGLSRGEINILINALEERIPLDLLATRGSMPRELLLTRLAKRLEEQLGMTETAALWAVETWALALNVISESEVRERENNRVNIESKDMPAADSNSGVAAEIKNKETDPVIYPAHTEPSKQPSLQRQATSQNKPSIYAAPPDPAVQTSGSISNQLTQATIKPQLGGKNAARANQAQSVNPSVRFRLTKGRSWTFRGCFIGCFLLIILLSIPIIGVPYTFKVMRQTQQPEIKQQLP